MIDDFLFSLILGDRLGFPHPDLAATNGSNVTNFNHTNIQNICPPTTQSDHGSSSGVSSIDDPERSRTNTIQPPTITSDDSNHSIPSNSPSSSSSSITQRPTNYKFKSSIKQRFSAERIKSSPSPVSSEKQNNNNGIPIFALHDAGSFYVPLTIESSLLRPHLNFIPDNGPDTVLHPVTISVNFNQTTPTIWSQHHSPNHEHSSFN